MPPRIDQLAASDAQARRRYVEQVLSDAGPAQDAAYVHSAQGTFHDYYFELYLAHVAIMIDPSNERDQPADQEELIEAGFPVKDDDAIIRMVRTFLAGYARTAKSGSIK
ncbi:hypothetical protein PMZ80_001352 [Knufia obscura]|nr:hypothetical protein PMZ80_001352 [Knufia obscura]